ncbi:MAG TPA: Crp/Fnr family transcriptional regulator [Spirochaetota bacterium]|jgi:CRP-like cAMP-binding protein|nr:Crp/Fnr family transcriptional regulator [Spirochaetota bacterium]
MQTEPLSFLLGTLDKFARIPEIEWNKTASALRGLRLGKNDYFVRQGDQPSRLAFIVSGLFRVYCVTEDGDEKTLAFRIPGQFLAAYTPFLEKKDSWYSIQALSEAELLYLPLDKFKKLSSEHPCWETVVKEYIVSLFIEKEDRERSFLTEDARTRYLIFIEKHPELVKRIPLIYIASYLGITPVSLSRIRGELKNR